MRKINKHSPPASLVEYIKKTIDYSYPPSDQQVMIDLKESLLLEQGWVCGYCQIKIKDVSKMKIEHHCEQSICNGTNDKPDKRLSYSNFLAVCKGNEGGKEQHCDSRKAQFTIDSGLPIEISPWNDSHISTIKYRSTGLVTSSNNNFKNEINCILNLNIDILKNQRKAKWIKIFRLSKHKQHAVFKSKMKKILSDDLNGRPRRFSNDFPGLSEFMLKEFC